MTDKIRVLVLDDSAFARSVIAKKLDADPDLEVVGFARDGLEALEKVKSLRPSVVTLDVSMPRMDGLEALERIMEDCPTPVVMLSALTGEQTQTTIAALERGPSIFPQAFDHQSCRSRWGHRRFEGYHQGRVDGNRSQVA